jgi:hypothetical protein
VVYHGYVPGLPPHEIVALVRSTGLVPLSRPMRRGPIYVLHAVDPAGQEVRVIVDARLGRILRVVPLLGPRYAMPVVPPPYGRPPGPIAMAPDGYGPNSRIAALPPGTGEWPRCRRSAGRAWAPARRRCRAPSRPADRPAAATATAQGGRDRLIRAIAIRRGAASLIVTSHAVTGLALTSIAVTRRGQGNQRHHRRGHPAGQPNAAAGRAVGVRHRS